MRRWRPGPALVTVAVIAVAAQTMGWFHGANDHWMNVAVVATSLAIAAVGVNLLLGYTGLLSLGHAGFLAVGGYAGGLLVPYLMAGAPGPEWIRANAAWWGIPGAFAAGALAGALLALMCCHLRGFHLTVVTLAFGALLPALVVAMSGSLGGVGGRRLEHYADTSGVPGAAGSFRTGLFYVAVTLLAVTLVGVGNLTRSRWGRALTAIRESEVAARASGLDTYWHKVGAFATSAGIVGLAGWLQAQNVLTVAVGDATNQSFRLVVYVVVGGMGSLVGPVVATFALQGALGWDAAQDLLADNLALVFGLAGIFVVGLAPRGLAGLVRLPRRRRPSPPESSPPTATVAPVISRKSDPDGETPLVLEGVVKRFGGVRALDGVSLSVPRATVHAVIGPNGSGKTTLLNAISGAVSIDEGIIRLDRLPVQGLAAPARSRLGLARTFQNLELWRRMTLLDTVLVGAHARMSTGPVSASLGLPAGRREERLAREHAMHLLAWAGLADRAGDRAGALPFADQRALELARALASDPTVLLLDEPAAGLHPDEIAGLVERLADLRGSGVSVVLVEHHMDVVLAAADHVTVLDEGTVLAAGTPADVASDPLVIEAYLGPEVHR